MTQTAKNKTCFGFIGLGLIGGSIAKSIKRVFQNNATIIAYDINQDTLSSAKEEGVIDIISPQIDKTFTACDFLFLCAPVSFNDQNLLFVRDYLSADCILTDVGSVKTNIHEQIRQLQLEHCFIGGHPMAGSEKTGFANASDRLIENTYYILTPTDSVPEASVNSYKDLVTKLGAIPLILDCKEHDYVTAAVSHLPHIIAASLVNLVQASDNREGIMKMIAAGGFKDITRIASSSSTMWQQISLENGTHIHSLLEKYISSLQKINIEVQTKDADALFALFDSARNYRDSFVEASRGPIKRIFSLYVDIPDVTGVIATIATILASHQINIRNIGIINNREFEEGALRIDFNDEESLQQAIITLQKHNYKIFKK
ncbi:MAG: prephenate dehydrogenase/arogenate dehydrogenase family protein [Lachnospiraceae bacterium]|nr:prephenate dehydrogenase/arogenate dehydrogenase family protein [Lachnospiraceae bacterium]